MTHPTPSAEFMIGATLPVSRMGYGTMQLTGPGHWDSPPDPDLAMALLRHAIDHGVTHIDTADAYGPQTAENLIRESLHPYPADLVIATKGGLTRQGPNRWTPVGRPEYLRQCVEMSLRRLAIDRIDLYYLHRIDPRVPLVDQLGVLAAMQQEGKIRHLGLSKVTISQLRQAARHVHIVAVQNKYHLGDRTHDDVLRHCQETGTAFVPYAPLGAGQLSAPHHVLDDAADHYGATRAQMALAWLLHRSPAILPIPGTSTGRHLRDNLAAATIRLDQADIDRLTDDFAQPDTHHHQPHTRDDECHRVDEVARSSACRGSSARWKAHW